jgi:hypothetical protein
MVGPPRWMGTLRGCDELAMNHLRSKRSGVPSRSPVEPALGKGLLGARLGEGGPGGGSSGKVKKRLNAHPCGTRSRIRVRKGRYLRRW